MICYRIVNTVNGKMYVGKTIQSLEKRWYHHKYDSYSPKRIKSLINKEILVYSHNNFQLEVLSQCDSLEQLNDAEKYFIDHFQSTFPNGYNLTHGGNGGALLKGSKRNQSVIDKFTKTINNYPKDKLRRIINSMSEANRKPVIDDLGNTFKSVNEAAKFYGLNRHSISISLNRSKQLQNGRSFYFIKKDGG